MPGLFGVFSHKYRDNAKSLTRFNDMARALNFCDYSTETYTNNHCFLGTIGPGAREKPQCFIFEKDEYIALIDGAIFSFNGKSTGWSLSELYTFITQCIQYPRNNAIASINGEFTIFIYNKSSHKLHLITDRFGFKKTYIAKNKHDIYIFPDFHAITVLPDISREPDYDCFIDHINFTYPVNDSTFLKNVKVIPNASIITMVFQKSFSYEQTKYWDWDLDYSKYKCSDINEYADTAYSLMKQSLTRRTKHFDKNCCISLSGGLDSRFLLNVICSSGIKPNTISYGYKKSLECEIAKKVAQTLNAPYYHISIGNDYVFEVVQLSLKYTDGMVPAEHLFHLNAIEKFIRTQTNRPNAHFSGFYGDAILAANFFTSEDIYLPIKNNEQMIGRLLRKRKALLNEVEKKMLLSDGFFKKVKKRELDYIDIYIDNDSKNKENYPYPLYIDRFYMSTHGRRYLSSLSFFRFYCYDIAPFFDYDFFDFYLSIPFEYRIDHKLYNLMYLRNMHEMASIPYNKTGRPVGNKASTFFKRRIEFTRKTNYYLSRLTNGKIIFNERYNYIQLSKWHHSVPDSIKTARDLLLEKHTLERGLLTASGIDYLYSEYKKGKWVGGTLLNLYFLELFFRKYLD